jgi:transcriptional regulator with PAS, ATPase and Fis domain
MNHSTAWILSEDVSFRNQLMHDLQALDCQPTFTCCAEWPGIFSEGDSPNIKWVLIDLRDPAPWNCPNVLRDVRDKLFRRGIFLIGVLNSGYTVDQAVSVRPLLDGTLHLPATGVHLRDFFSQLPASPKRCNGRSEFSSSDERVLETENLRFVTRAPNLFSIFDQLPVAAKHDFTILLVGETGTGKTYLARIIHELSQRREEPYVHVACGALQNELMDSELFGHIKGSFTGADCNKEGKFAVAKRGTLLLDEIDVLRPPQQAKLLRVLESGEYERIGCNETRRMTARLIVTTNVDLESLIEKEMFRSDLYFRLKQVKFEIPPLRNRPVDVFPLALQFIEQFCRDHGMAIHRIHPDLPAALEAYAWPGNIRELRNEISRAVLFCKDGILDPTTLSPKIQHAERNAGNAHAQPRLASEIAQTEQSTIECMLRAHSFNRAATARALGISRVTLYNKIRKYRIQVSAG